MRSLPNAARLTVVIAATTVLAALAVAQTPPQWGLPRFGVKDRLNSTTVYVPNADATFTIPIFSKRGRGPGFAVAMLYNSNFYWNSGTSFGPNPDTNGPWIVEPSVGAVFYDEHSVSSRDGNGWCLYDYYNNFRYYDQNGAMHPLPGAYLAGDGMTTYPLPLGTCHAGTLSTRATATDGSGFTLSITATGGDLFPKNWSTTA